MKTQKSIRLRHENKNKIVNKVSFKIMEFWNDLLNDFHHMKAKWTQTTNEMTIDFALFKKSLK